MLYVAGFEVDGERPQIVGVLAFSALMLTAAWGMWKVRYWAVLGMQTLLGLLIVILSLVLVTARERLGRAAAARDHRPGGHSLLVHDQGDGPDPDAEPRSVGLAGRNG